MKMWAISVVVIVIFFIGVAFLQNELFDVQFTRGWDTSDREKICIQVGDESLTVEAVTRPASITQGLSGRESIGSDGMLFLFEEPRRTSFWMKDMQFDLDLVWIREGKIVDITTMVPAPESELTTQALPSYPSPGSVTAVLEIPAGKAASYEWKQGFSVTQITCQR